jgi:hypothetical protein
MAEQSASHSTETPGAESYSHCANSAFEAELALRTAAKEAAFFLPMLRAGMRVLDLGCGPAPRRALRGDDVRGAWLGE